ncbi:sulfite exporter TauE/SafE family protein [Agarivorans sp. 1_MG-2023]|uniref:sulfite exporter TauE/SafE family protein n=1 Tax=Agarivorans sp. 1_MG-2023 TaxID=3062634 RepID=UPI0026E148EC|nr:sulfite exporter TauE/SafE family protein [Agarivorans sp. 1_MG-2023]MDO6765520.1 sulfite exporter TauE/SafE family protein [Agarivorans sp. 1_MG-2023]
MMFLSFLLIGAAAGLMSGLFGIGGGLVIVPVLIGSFGAMGFASESAIHLAIGTSLASIIITASSASYAHYCRGSIDWNIVQRLGGGIVFGSMLGAWVATRLHADHLTNYFAGFLLVMALYMAFGRTPKAQRCLPGPAGTSLLGAIVGCISAMFGIGGGTITFPSLSWYGVSAPKAVAISAVCGLPIALVGTVAYIYNGWHEADLPAWSLGYVYLPAWLGIVLTSSIFARLGSRLAYRLPAKRLKQAFALLLLVMAIKLLIE